MPIYDFGCDECGKVDERFVWSAGDAPMCCGVDMFRLYTIGWHIDKYSAPLWVHRMDDIQRRENQDGSRTRLVHPREVM